MRLLLITVLAAFLCALLTPVVAFCLIIVVGLLTGYSMDFGWTMLVTFIVTMLLAVSAGNAKAKLAAQKR